MKIVCDYCKAEYTLNKIPNTPVKCAVCGHTWLPHRPLSQRSTIKFIATLCAFIAACIFAFVVIVQFQQNRVNKNKPLVATIDQENVRIVKDSDGNNRIFVSGNITNTTDDMYGLPNITIISYDGVGNMLSRQNFIPPVTLLESKTTVTFNYMLSVVPTDVKRLSVELKESK